MASTEHLIKITLRLQDEMSAPIQKSAVSLEKLKSSLNTLGTQFSAAFTAPIVAGGVAMMKAYSDFENVLAELEARTGSTSEEMKKMSDLAIKMGRDTAFSATEAAQALLELTSSGSSAAEAMAQLPAVLDLAAAGALELGAAADAVTDVLAQFQLEAKDAAMVADELARAAGASSATVSDLVQAFQNVGPVAAQFGLDVNETAAALATLAENGVKGAEAGTMLKSMLLNMSADTIPARAAWEQLGISMYDAQGNMRDIDEIFKDINRAMEGMSMKEQNEIAQALAGSYGLVGFNALRASNGISDMQGAMSNAAGASEVAQARMNTLSGRLDSLMGSFETLGIVLGGLAAGPLNDLIGGLTSVVNAVTDWAAANPEMAQFVMIILGIVAAIGPLLLIIGQLIAAWQALATVIAFVSTIMALPLAPIILLVAALVLLAMAIFNNWFGIRDIIWGAVQAIVDAVYWLIAQVQTAFTTLLMLCDMVVKGWQGLLNQAGTIFGQLGVIIGKGVQSGLQQAGTALSQLGSIIWERLKTLASQMWTLGQAIINGLINGIKSKAVDLIAYVFGLSKEMTAAIKKALGISSPSKVMMEIGADSALGFQKGIAGAGGLEMGSPTLGGRSARTSGGMALAGAGGGNTYITIENINMPPGSTKEQVKHLMKEFGKETKKKGGGLVGNGR